MGSDNAGLDQLKAAPWDRFAGWDRWPARILLLVVAALLVLAAIAPLSASLDGKPSEVPSLIDDGPPNGQTESERDDDLAFYDRVIERIGHGVRSIEDPKLVDYLAELGVSHLYLSPILTATEGSGHGYDVTDPTTVSAELGGAEGFARLVASAARTCSRSHFCSLPRQSASSSRLTVWSRARTWDRVMTVRAGTGAASHTGGGGSSSSLIGGAQEQCQWDGH